MAFFAGHIPSPYESLVYYYGVYSSSYRGKEKRGNADEVVVQESRATGKANSTWARLIRKIFEVDVLRCKKCGGEMKIIAFITRHSETRKILKHIKEETARPPPLLPTSWAPAQDNWSADYMPPLEEYMQDPEYAN